MQDKEAYSFSRTLPTNAFPKNPTYHLKKIEPYKNRPKRTVADQMKIYNRIQKVSTIGIQNKKKLINKPQVRTQHQHQPDIINEQHARQNLANCSSQIKIYQNPYHNHNRNQSGGTSARNGKFAQPNNSNNDKKDKKIQLAQRGKSLKYWQISKPQPKFITHIRGFFNTFLTQDDGCKCGAYCQCSEVLMKWIGVSEELINKNYQRLLKIAFREKYGQKHKQKQHQHQKTTKPNNSNNQFNFRNTQFSNNNPNFKNKPNNSNLNSNIDQQYQQYLKHQKQHIKYRQQIQKDVIRTQTQSQLFQRPQIQQKLARILICYMVQDPEVGYVQSMNVVLSGVLYHVRNQAKCYAIVRKLFHQIRPIYLHDFKQCYKHVSNITLQIEHQLQDLHTHLLQLSVQLPIIIFPWVLSLLCVLIPLQYIHLVYINFIKKGWNFIYRTILALFVYHKQKIMRLNQAGDILVFLSVSNNQQEGGKEGIDWEDIIKYGDSLQLVFSNSNTNTNKNTR